MTELFNKKSLKDKRRYLRSNMPPAEALVWQHIKNKQIEGFRFLRQFSINNYIADFYSPQLNLVIEIDGDSHVMNEEAKVYDKKRESFLNH